MSIFHLMIFFSNTVSSPQWTMSYCQETDEIVDQPTDRERTKVGEVRELIR